MEVLGKEGASSDGAVKILQVSSSERRWNRNVL